MFFDQSDLFKQDLTNNKNQLSLISQNMNKINGISMDQYIFGKIMQKVDPITYCESILRRHLPSDKQKLHPNQIELIRAVCNPNVRKIAALMARQAGKTESIASFTGYLLDNLENIKIGIFTPRIQQAQIDVGRTATFFQMNEKYLNNKIKRCNKNMIELSNNSYVMAVSASDQSNIEGLTFDYIVLDEAQKISNYTVSERIVPMGGATNAKLIKIGTPKSRNHFYESFQEKSQFHTIIKDWTQCAQLWANGATYLPDAKTGEIRPYSTYVMNLMPKSLKQEYFPNNPETWTDGEMTPVDFKTQYMLEFVLDIGLWVAENERNLFFGDFLPIKVGQPGEIYYAGIDFAGSDAEGSDYTHISVVRMNPNGTREKVYAEEMFGTDYYVQKEKILNLFRGPDAKFQTKKIFADMTGCGKPIIDILRAEGLTQLEGIVFNASDKYTRSGMNMKNLMFTAHKADLHNGKFKYPVRESIDKNGKYQYKDFIFNKSIQEWFDLEFEVNEVGINKKIFAGGDSHDDAPCADVLANFAATNGRTTGRSMPKPSLARATRF